MSGLFLILLMTFLAKNYLLDLFFYLSAKKCILVNLFQCKPHKTLKYFLIKY